MKGTAASQSDRGKYSFDETGKLVREEDETDEAYVARTAEVLYKEGMSGNNPEHVATQYDDPEPPPPEIEEGESAEDHAKKVHDQKEEWGKKNAENRKEAYEKEKSAEDERASARKELRKEQGFVDNQDEEQQESA